MLRTVVRCLAVLGVGLMAATAGAGEEPLLKTQKEKVSYELGVDVARDIQRRGIEIDADLVMKGFRDALSGQKLLMSEKELRNTRTAVQYELRNKAIHDRRIAAIDNKAAGDAFLAENKMKEGVVTLPSGLQYKILKEGHGRMPAESDTVVCSYQGTLIDGTVFDSSDGANQQATFKMNTVISGWREALKLMPVGSKWQLFIPPQLAYGQQGSGNDIGPNATLIFTLELVSIQ
jgi:UDP-GlcNAc:undecaprenyl-phosphate/decaprenyl-phosphate GlcNAc-1-phosphate transferase